MQGLSGVKWWGSAIGLMLGLSGELGLSSPMAIAAHVANAASSRTEMLLSQRLECRQVAPERGAPFYSTLPQQSRAANDFLPQRSRVSLDTTAGAIRAPDGQFYHFVTYPFGSPNTVTGYIPVQTRTANGVRTTLDQCRRRMW
jgi:hypothetical protein